MRTKLMKGAAMDARLLRVYNSLEDDTLYSALCLIEKLEQEGLTERHLNILSKPPRSGITHIGEGYYLKGAVATLEEKRELRKRIIYGKAIIPLWEKPNDDVDILSVAEDESILEAEQILAHEADMVLKHYAMRSKDQSNANDAESLKLITDILKKNDMTSGDLIKGIDYYSSIIEDANSNPRLAKSAMMKAIEYYDEANAYYLQDVPLQKMEIEDCLTPEPPKTDITIEPKTAENTLKIAYAQPVKAIMFNKMLRGIPAPFTPKQVREWYRNNCGYKEIDRISWIHNIGLIRKDSYGVYYPNYDAIEEYNNLAMRSPHMRAYFAIKSDNFTYCEFEKTAPRLSADIKYLIQHGFVEEDARAGAGHYRKTYKYGPDDMLFRTFRYTPLRQDEMNEIEISPPAEPAGEYARDTNSTDYTQVNEYYDRIEREKAEIEARKVLIHYELIARKSRDESKAISVITDAMLGIGTRDGRKYTTLELISAADTYVASSKKNKSRRKPENFYAQDDFSQYVLTKDIFSPDLPLSNMSKKVDAVLRHYMAKANADGEIKRHRNAIYASLMGEAIGGDHPYTVEELIGAIDVFAEKCPYLSKATKAHDFFGNTKHIRDFLRIRETEEGEKA